MNKTHGSAEQRLYITPEAQSNTCGLNAVRMDLAWACFISICQTLPDQGFAGFPLVLQEGVDWGIGCTVTHIVEDLQNNFIHLDIIQSQSRVPGKQNFFHRKSTVTFFSPFFRSVFFFQTSL